MERITETATQRDQQTLNPEDEAQCREWRRRQEEHGVKPIASGQTKRAA